MADTSTHLMLDDVTLSIIESHDSAAYAVAGYVNGRYANWASLVAKYGKSGKFLLSISVTATPSAGAQCLDIETGDATNAQAPAWVKATQAAGKAAKDLRYYPKVYTSASNAQALINELSAAGIKRDEYMLWSAHYTNKAHICSPSACGYPAADATQYTDTYGGVSLDGSLCYGYFFAGAPSSETAAAASPAKAAAPADAPAPTGFGVDYKTVNVTVKWNSMGDHTYTVDQYLGSTLQKQYTNLKATTLELPSLQQGKEYTVRVYMNPAAGQHADEAFITFTA